MGLTPLPSLTKLSKLISMRNLTATICLTIAVLLGSAACVPNSGQGPVIGSDTVSKKSDSGLEVPFIQMQVNLRSEPGLRSPVTKVVKQAISKKALLLKQNKTWIQIRFEEEDFWVHALFLDRNLTPRVMEVLFKVSDVNLRSGPGTRFPISKVLKDAKFRRAVPFGKFEDWMHIVFDKHPYWVHSSLILQHGSSAISSKSADQSANQLSYFDEQKIKAAAGDPKAMEMVSGIYEHDGNLHLRKSYMWLSLAMDKTAHAAPKLNRSAPTTASVASMRRVINRNAKRNVVSRRMVPNFRSRLRGRC